MIITLFFDKLVRVSVVLIFLFRLKKVSTFAQVQDGAILNPAFL